jgi:hypothetical protein
VAKSFFLKLGIDCKFGALLVCRRRLNYSAAITYVTTVLLCVVLSGQAFSVPPTTSRDVANATLTGSEVRGSVTVDGIMNQGEFSGLDSGHLMLDWWNGHNSIYTLGANTNHLYWEIINDGNASFSLAIFVEVPVYARRMIWAKGCDYKTNKPDSGDCGHIGAFFLEPYFEGSHHNSVKMDYNTQTSS